MSALARELIAAYIDSFEKKKKKLEGDKYWGSSNSQLTSGIKKYRWVWQSNTR